MSSDVEKYYYAVQKHLGGNRPWSNLNPMEQMQFVQAINTILGLCQSVGGDNNG